MIRTLFLVLFICLLQGCTLIGFSAGIINEASRSDEFDAPHPILDNLKSDKNIIVVLTNNDTLKGKVDHLQKVNKDEYISRYSAIYPDNKKILPAISDTLFLKENKYIFNGFGYRRFFFWEIEGKEEINIHFKYAKHIKNQTANEYDLDKITRMMRDHQIPFVEQLVIKNDEEKKTIPLESIKYIKYANSSPAPLIGAAIGLMIDLLVLKPFFKNIKIGPY